MKACPPLIAVEISVTADSAWPHLRLLRSKENGESDRVQGPDTRPGQRDR
jgi:hypothetical protein